MVDSSDKGFKPTVVTTVKQRATQRKVEAWVQDKVVSDKTLWDVAVLHSGYGKRDFNTDKLFNGTYEKPEIEEVLEKYITLDLDYPEGLTLSNGAEHFYKQFMTVVDEALKHTRSSPEFIEDVEIDLSQNDYTEWGFMEVGFRYKCHPTQDEIDGHKEELKEWVRIKSFEPKIRELYEGYLKRNEELKQEESDKRKAELLAELKKIEEE